MAIHVPIAGLALAPILLGMPPLFFPMHVVLLELIIDPVCSLAFEAERSEARAMQRPPRPVSESLFGRRQMILAMLQGSALLAAVFALYAVGLGAGVGGESPRTQAMIALVTGNLSLALSETGAGSSLIDRSRIVFWSIVGIAVLVFTMLILLPTTAEALQMTPLAPDELMIALGVGLAGGGWYGAFNRLRLYWNRLAQPVLDTDQARSPPAP
jgi:Ca2+-transporting ATPase